ncbi:MAG: hypothetical protein ACREUH_01085 [Burkholderiales bacterium]
MRTLALLLLAVAATTVSAQTNVRVRGTITQLDGDVLLVKSRDGRELQLNLAPNTQVVTAKAATLAEFKPGSYVGVTSVKGADGRLVARRVHALGPQVPSGHTAWDSIPDSLMTNANLTGTAQLGAGNELTLKYKDGEQKILVTRDTEYFTFVPGSRADLKPGETIFSGARLGDDGKFTTQRVAVSKDGVKPPQ